ncbi:MAG TPA: hypothetical protein VJ725_26930 [Thermoanaerobaculia bacterium]|nr:hypothetical protein [Thermoanaerobaculia bacterium]
MTRVEPSEAEGSDQATQSEAGLDEALADSFPASDPPFWTLGLPGRDESDAPEDAGAPPSRSRHPGCGEGARQRRNHG